MNNIWTFVRGETISIPLNFTAEGGDSFADVTSVESWLRRAADNLNPPSSPVWLYAATFDISEQADDAGWVMTIPSDTSETLSYGKYVADAKLVISGGVVYMDELKILINEPVTAP